ncbi:Histone transcription regulator 3 [Apophysomyces sp. BC1021]|nr:Histone transcription regulator 3 [Apophysomyces sp. BC1021]
MACRAIGEFKSCAMDQKDDPTQNHKRRNMLLRYWLLRGKMAQCNENIQDAYEWYMRCGQALKEIEDEEGDESPALIDIKCCYDSVISREKIDRKLDVLKIGNQAVFARNELAVKNYDGVISLLEDSVRAQPKPDVHNGSAELHETLAMLAEAYINTDSNVKAWECYSSMLCRSVAEFISYGCTQTKEKVILRRDEDHDFFKSLKTIDMLVSKLLDLASTKNMQGMRLGFGEHPDFIPLVNNFPVQDNPPHIPSPKTKSGGFNDTMTRIWTLQSILFNQVITSNPSLGADAYSVLAEFLLATHEELGEREICGSAKGIFLRHLLDVLIKMEDVEYRRSIYQCYHCLYGVHVAAEGDPIEEHHSPHSELTQKASEPLFALVADTIVEKVDRGSPLRSDLKDIVDIVALLFEKPPVENYRVKFNQKNIDAYLNKEIYLPQTMNQLQGTARLSTMTVDSAGSTISPVYFKIFWARGKMFRLQIKNRTKVNPERTIEDLEEAIDEFTNHLTLNPNDIRGWYELGLSLMQLAEEELIWSASNITAHKKKIAEYQKKGYHALLKAWDLSRTNSVKLDGETMFDLLNSFGYLIYSIVCRPMNMEALGKQSIRHAMGKDGKLYEVSQERVDPKLGYKMALMMFTNALRYKCADSLEWQPLYMSGKCFSKLSRPPKETLEWYHRAAQKAPSRPDQHGQEKVLEPFYKLCSTLVKYLYQGKIEPSVVSEFLESGLGVSQDTNPNTAETSCPPDETSVTGVPTSLYVPATHAWMHYYVYKNTEKAKAELSQFFTLKTNTKSPISIWKPDYERPGKHFEYVYKYTVFLVELAKASKDIDTLKQLCRKARRAQTVLLRDDEVFLAAYSAYLEIVQWQMLSCYRAQSRVDGLLNTFVNKRLFEEFCREYSNTVSKASPKPELVSLLHDLLDIRRLAHGHTSTVNVDDVVAQCYAVVLHDHGNLEQFLLAETNKTENGTEAQPAEEAKVKMTNDILIEQAKTLYSAY